MWILLAFSGPFFWALSTHMDKYLVEKYFKHADTTILMVFTALIGIFVLPLIYLYDHTVIFQPTENIIVMIISGLLYMSSMHFYLKAIQTSEASVIAPLFQMTTLFTFVLGYFILNESLTFTNSIGAIFIILGVLVLSVNKNMKFGKFKLKMFLMMVLCTFVLSLSSVIFKYFAISEDFWGTTFWTYVGDALFGVAILARPKYLKQFLLLLKVNTNALLSINAVNELVNLSGGIVVRFASLFVPLVIISAISSTTTLFVFIIGIFLTIFFPKIAKEDITFANLIHKGIAGVLVAIGVALAQI